jgi:hypothetical protein
LSHVGSVPLLDELDDDELDDDEDDEDEDDEDEDDEDDELSLVIVAPLASVHGVVIGFAGNWRSLDPPHKLGPSAPHPEMGRTAVMFDWYDHVWV